MEDQEYKSLQQRVEELEQEVWGLKNKLNRLISIYERSPYREQRQPREETAPSPEPLRTNKGEKALKRDKPGIKAEKKSSVETFGGSLFGENWLYKIGIILLLLGMAYLFKYSIDQGWITPPIRSAFGLMVGVVLVISGQRLDISRRPYRQILMGGGIATFYITGFATFQLFDFAPPLLIWIFMIGITLFALFMALQQDEEVLSVVGTVGGLGTPFMLYTGSGSLPGLIIYTALILSGSGALYYFRKWKLLLWTSAAGGYLVLAVGLINSIFFRMDITLLDRWVLQAGILFEMLLFWILPVFRSLNEDTISADSTGDGKSLIIQRSNNLFQVQILTLVVPVVALYLSIWTWPYSIQPWSWAAFGGSLLFFGVATGLQRYHHRSLQLTHYYSSALLLTIGFFLFLENNLLFLILAAEALAFRIMAQLFEDKNFSLGSHILALIVSVWLVDELINATHSGWAIFNPTGISNVLIITAIGVGIPWFMKKENPYRSTYLIFGHLAFLGWLVQQFRPLADGDALITISWGVYAVVLLVWGFQRNSDLIRKTAMATVFLTVGKLVLVDFSQLEAIWRILMFIGFGGFFLLISYYIQKYSVKTIEKTE